MRPQTIDDVSQGTIDTPLTHETENRRLQSRFQSKGVHESRQSVPHTTPLRLIKLQSKSVWVDAFIWTKISVVFVTTPSRFNIQTRTYLRSCKWN